MSDTYKTYNRDIKSTNTVLHVPYKTIYWREINIGNWRFFRKFANINNYMDTPTKPLLKMKKLKKKDAVAQIANIKSANCFSQTISPNITLANKYFCTFVQVLLYSCIMYILYMGRKTNDL